MGWGSKSPRNDSKHADDNVAGAGEPKPTSSKTPGKRRATQFRFDKDGAHNIPLIEAAIKVKPYDTAKWSRVPAAWAAVVTEVSTVALPKKRRGSKWVYPTWDNLKPNRAQERVSKLLADYCKRHGMFKKVSGEEEEEDGEGARAHPRGASE